MNELTAEDIERLTIYEALYNLLIEAKLDGQEDAAPAAHAVFLLRYLLRLTPTSAAMESDQAVLQQALAGPRVDATMA